MAHFEDALVLCRKVGYQPELAWPGYFGRDAQGAIRGTLLPFKFVSGSGGPVLAGFLYDLRSDYVMAFSVFTIAFALGSVAAILARPPQLVPALQLD